MLLLRVPDRLSDMCFEWVDERQTTTKTHQKKALIAVCLQTFVRYRLQL
jgi:hypothetical protein